MLGTDERGLLLARGLRGFAAGLLSIVLAVDLAASGATPIAVGLLVGLAIAASAAWTLLAPALERRSGRRALLVLESLAMALGGTIVFAGTGSLPAVVVALSLGGVSASSSDVSALGALEQAALAESTRDGQRTEGFARYNLAGYVGGALGLLVASPIALAGAALTGSGAPGPHDLVLLAYGLLGLTLIPVYRSLSVSSEPSVPVASGPVPDGPVRPAVRTMAALFAVDAFAGGLITNALVVYLFQVRYGAGLTPIGIVLFASTVASALSLLAAPALVRRIGLVPTIVFSHLPSNVLLILVAFAPSFPWAAFLWIARSSISQIDVPTRQAFTQAIVDPSERTAAAGLTTAARSTQALGAPVTGGLIGAGAAGLPLPFAVAGGVKMVYDIAFFVRFRSVRVGPEVASPPARITRARARDEGEATTDAPR